jgi:hypothetical protein
LPLDGGGVDGEHAGRWEVAASLSGQPIDQALQRFLSFFGRCLCLSAGWLGLIDEQVADRVPQVADLSQGHRGPCGRGPDAELDL